MQVFEDSAFGSVRVIMRGSEPWFVAADVRRIFDHSNATMALERLDDDERAKFNLGRQDETNIINEPGLYTLVIGSREPEAKFFRQWITHEVLPTIRKHGMYKKNKSATLEWVRGAWSPGEAEAGAIG